MESVVAPRFQQCYGGCYEKIGKVTKIGGKVTKKWKKYNARKLLILKEKIKKK
jgi:hypothetical protein